VSFWDKIGAAAGAGIAEGAMIGMERTEELDRERRAEERAAKARLSAALTTAIANNHPGEVRNLRAEAANKGWTGIVSRADAALDGVESAWEREQSELEAENELRNLKIDTTKTAQKIQALDLTVKQDAPKSRLAQYETEALLGISGGNDYRVYEAGYRRLATIAGHNEKDITDKFSTWEKRAEEFDLRRNRREREEFERKVARETKADDERVGKTRLKQYVAEGFFGPHLNNENKIRIRQKYIDDMENAGVDSYTQQFYKNRINAPAEDPEEQKRGKRDWIDIEADKLLEENDGMEMSVAYGRAGETWKARAVALEIEMPGAVDHVAAEDWRKKNFPPYINPANGYETENLLIIDQTLQDSGMNEATIKYLRTYTPVALLKPEDRTPLRARDQPSSTEIVIPELEEVREAMVGVPTESPSAQIAEAAYGTGGPSIGITRWISELWQGREMSADDAFERVLPDVLWKSVRDGLPSKAAGVAGDERYLDIEGADRVVEFKMIYNAVYDAIGGEGDLDRLKELRVKAVALGAAGDDASKLIALIDKSIEIMKAHLNKENWKSFRRDPGLPEAVALTSQGPPRQGQGRSEEFADMFQQAAR